MKVLALVTDAYGGHGGIALYNRELFQALSTHASQPAVTVIPRIVTKVLEPLPRNLRFLDGARNSKLRFVLTYVAHLLRGPTPDLILCTHVNLLPFAQIARTLRGGKIVLFVYGLDVWQPTPRAMANALVAKIDALVSIRQYTAARVRSWAGLERVPTFILENAIHLERYGVRPRNAELVERFGLQGKRVVMTLGRVEEVNKGFDEVLQVFPELAAEYPDLVYVVAGGGYDIARLEAKARALGIADRVVFTGPVPEAEKPDYYRLADVFAMPGTGWDFDRYPLRFVFIEAMACGVPIVAGTPEDPAESSRVLGLPTIEVDPLDAESIRRGIREALAVEQRAVPDALTNYAFPAFERKVHALVDALATAPSSAPDRHAASTRAESARS